MQHLVYLGTIEKLGFVFCKVAWYERTIKVTCYGKMLRPNAVGCNSFHLFRFVWIRNDEFLSKQDQGSISSTFFCATFMYVGVNFINVFRAAFMHADPKSVKRHWWLNWNVTLSGIWQVKASRRTLMKLTPSPKSKKRHCWLDRHLFAHFCCLCLEVCNSKMIVQR